MILNDAWLTSRHASGYQVYAVEKEPSIWLSSLCSRERTKHLVIKFMQ